MGGEKYQGLCSHCKGECDKNDPFEVSVPLCRMPAFVGTFEG